MALKQMQHSQSHTPNHSLTMFKLKAPLLYIYIIVLPIMMKKKNELRRGLVWWVELIMNNDDVVIGI